jgi:hypothetical protein
MVSLTIYDSLFVFVLKRERGETHIVMRPFTPTYQIPPPPFFRHRPFQARDEEGEQHGFEEVGLMVDLDVLEE